MIPAAVVVSAFASLLTVGVGPRTTPVASAAGEQLDATAWVLPVPPPRCTSQQTTSGQVAGCVVAFNYEPSAVGFGQPPAPGIGTGWSWNGYRYNGSPALAGWEATQIGSNAEPVAGQRAGTIQTHVAAQALFEGFLDEISTFGYRVRDVSGYSFRCTSGNGGWSCPSGDPNDLSNHAYGLAIDMNAGTNPIATYASVGGATACQTPITTDLPRWVIQTAEKWGLYWGGYGWNTGCPSLDTLRTIVSRDPPHFEFRGTPAQATAIAAYNRSHDPLAICTTVVDDAGVSAQRCNRSGRPEAGWRLPVTLTPPAGAVAAMVNVTAADATAPGFLTLESCGATSGPRTTSAINYVPGQAVAAMAVVPLDAQGRFCVFRSSSVHSIVDVAAYLTASGDRLWFEPGSPTRLTDTRVDGVCTPGAGCVPGPPSDATTHVVTPPTGAAAAMIVNLTSSGATSPGWLQVGRCADVGPAGTFSNLNVSGDGGARANLAIVAAGASGSCAFSLSGGDIVVDRLGSLSADPASAGFGWKLTPSRRAIDTRECATIWCAGQPVPGTVVRVELGTQSPGAVLSVVATDTAGPGFLTVGRCSEFIDGLPPSTSNVNYLGGSTVAGLVVTAVEDGAVCVYTHAGAHVIVDVQAELTREHAIGLQPVTPIRVHDSRVH